MQKSREFAEKRQTVLSSGPNCLSFAPVAVIFKIHGQILYALVSMSGRPYMYERTIAVHEVGCGVLRGKPYSLLTRPVWSPGNPVSFHLENSRKSIFMLSPFPIPIPIPQKIVLTPLNNEFGLKKYSTSFMLKNPPIFLKKIYKNQFLPSLRGLMVLVYIYNVVYC